MPAALALTRAVMNTEHSKYLDMSAPMDMRFYFAPLALFHSVLLMPTFSRSRPRLSLPLLPLSALLCTLLSGVALANELPEVKVYGQQEAVTDALTQVHDRATLTSEGDGSVLEYLARQPGIAVDADGYISLRGMGAGYTQVLINGQQLDALDGDVMLEGISMEMVERVEIVRGASATDSGAGIAGTIRIVTRQATGPVERKVSMRTGFSPRGAFQHQLALATGARSQALEWQLNASLSHAEKKSDVLLHERQAYMGGAAFNNSYSAQKGQQRSNQAMLAGEVAVRPTGQDRLGLSWIAELQPEQRQTNGSFLMRYEEPADSSMGYEYRSKWRAKDHVFAAWSVMPVLRWDHQLAGGGLLQTELGSKQARNRQGYTYALLEGGFMGGEGEESIQRQRDYHASIQWSQAWSSTSRTTLGSQLRTERSGATYVEGDDSFSEKLRRDTTAAFAQWNWSPSAAWMVETGLRHERMALTSPAETQLDRRTQNLWLPSLHIGYSPNPLQRWHLQLAKTYRAPKFEDLSDYVREREGNFTQPDLGGNPHLRNETATGLELGFSQVLLRDQRNVGQFKVNLFARDISNGLSKELAPYAAEDWNGNPTERWMLTTVNRGKTRIWGLESGVRYDLAALPLSVRADLTLTQSRVAGQAAPARLMGQSPAVLDLGFDARTQSAGLLPERFGATLRLEAGYKSRVNPEMWGRMKPLATLHLHSLWKLEHGVRLRAQVSGLGNDWRTTYHPTLSEPYVTSQVQQLRVKRFWSAALVLEKDF